MTTDNGSAPTWAPEGRDVEDFAKLEAWQTVPIVHFLNLRFRSEAALPLVATGAILAREAIAGHVRAALAGHPVFQLQQRKRGQQVEAEAYLDGLERQRERLDLAMRTARAELSGGQQLLEVTRLADEAAAIDGQVSTARRGIALLAEDIQAARAEATGLIRAALTLAKNEVTAQQEEKVRALCAALAGRPETNEIVERLTAKDHIRFSGDALFRGLLPMLDEILPVESPVEAAALEAPLASEPPVEVVEPVAMVEEPAAPEAVTEAKPARKKKAPAEPAPVA